MKIHNVFSVLFFVYTIFSGYAQESEIKKIREMYNSYNLKIQEQGNDSHLELPLKIIIRSVMTERSVGPVEKSVTFFYDRIEKIENDRFTYSDLLRKIVLVEEASWKSYTEFLFDEKGKLVFVFFKHEGYIYNCKEERYYFKNGELIKIILNTNLEGMFPAECAEGTRELTKLTQNDKQNASSKQMLALKYLDIFKLYVQPN